jgi:hypothetical protein
VSQNPKNNSHKTTGNLKKSDLMNSFVGKFALRVVKRIKMFKKTSKNVKIKKAKNVS